jgi:hypothetical protein
VPADAAGPLQDFKELHLLTLMSPGVYFLCLGDKVVYVGQSLNPPSRASAHLASRIGFDRVYVLPVPREALDLVEGALIRSLKPKLNGEGRRGRHVSGPDPAAGKTAIKGRKGHAPKAFPEATRG